MAKCPRCSERKGKRRCPALSADICPSCCAENRLTSIPCPPDCMYLEGEHYQHRRRQEHAFSRGRTFVEGNQTTFRTRKAQDFAFNLQADIYFFMKEQGALANGPSAEAIDDLRRSSGRVLLPGSPSRLGAFLRERLDDAKRYPATPDFTVEDRDRAIRDLAARVRSLGPDDSMAFHEELKSFFDSLDFEADLDYSPHDGKGEAQSAQRTTPGGLILPPGAGG